MPKLPSLLFKTLLGIAVSMSSIPFMSNSASAASFTTLSGVYNLASQNNSSTQEWCGVPSISSGGNQWNISLSCSFRYTANNRLGITTAGSHLWRNIWQNFSFLGSSNRRYNITYGFSGRIQSRASTAGVAGAGASSGIQDFYTGRQESILVPSALFTNISPSPKYLSSTINGGTFNGSRNFYLGARMQGLATAFGVGNAFAESLINFTNTATIRDIGSRLGSSAAFARTSSSDLDSVYDQDLYSVPDQNLDSFFGEDLDSVYDQDLDSFSDRDFASIPSDDITTSVPEPTTLAGLVLVGAMLLASKRSRSTKRDSEEVPKFASTASVDI